MSGFVVNPNNKGNVGSVKPKKKAWYVLSDTGKRIFISRKKAEELMKQGNLVLFAGRKMDL